MFNDSICESTSLEFELAYSDMQMSRQAGGGHDYIFRMNDYESIIGDQGLDRLWVQPDLKAIFQQGPDTDVTINSNTEVSHVTSVYPWQNLGDGEEHWDLYQRYSLDTRFVPEHYTKFVSGIVHQKNVETECLVEQKIYCASKSSNLGRIQTGKMIASCNHKPYTHNVSVLMGDEIERHYRNTIQFDQQATVNLSPIQSWAIRMITWRS